LALAASRSSGVPVSPFQGVKRRQDARDLIIPIGQVVEKNMPDAGELVAVQVTKEQLRFIGTEQHARAFPGEPRQQAVIEQLEALVSEVPEILLPSPGEFFNPVQRIRVRVEPRLSRPIKITPIKGNRVDLRCRVDRVGADDATGGLDWLSAGDARSAR
jgi:hypothetical protein